MRPHGSIAAREISFAGGTLARLLRSQAFVEESRKEQTQQVFRERGDDTLGRQVFAVEMIDAAVLGLRGDEVVGEFGNAAFHARSVGLNGANASGQAGRNG